ncbi:MAG: hypothetical protein NZ518_01125 [Dehalococcoidia bacterium]|nr:hypothetical protein [Dehalococcoidia bacterium]
MSQNQSNRPPEKGLLDPTAHEPRFILYVFILMAAAIFFPGASQNWLLSVVTLLTGGPVITVLAVRAFPRREEFAFFPRLIVEVGVFFGLAMIVLGVLRAFNISFVS